MSHVQKKVSRGTESAARDAVVMDGDGAEDTPTKGPKATGYAAQKRWHHRLPKAGWAHAALRSAVRLGLVEKKPVRSAAILT